MPPKKVKTLEVVTEPIVQEVVEPVKETKTKKASKTKEVVPEPDPEPIIRIEKEPIKKEPITNAEFIKLKEAWYKLAKEIEECNIMTCRLEEEKNILVSKMYVIIENSQPKIENIIEQKSNNITSSKQTISTKLLQSDSDSSDSSDSDDSVVSIKKQIIKKKQEPVSDSDDSDSD